MRYIGKVHAGQLKLKCELFTIIALYFLFAENKKHIATDNHFA
jgi:hypothetical protein